MLLLSASFACVAVFLFYRGSQAVKLGYVLTALITMFIIFSVVVVGVN